MDDDAGYVIERGLPRKSVDVHVPKTLEREVRFVDFLPFPFQDVRHLLVGRTQVFRIKVAVFVEYLRVSQGNRGTGGTLYGQANAPDHVLAHVEDDVAFRRAN